ncbi:MAG TPA: DUF6798 domain-containing protein [Acidobacteriaceae bacterium]|jgi:hypothetical protein|nr:DUF6798 domain-containing protein [Acidobacteriaceae bacterium]
MAKTVCSPEDSEAKWKDLPFPWLTRHPITTIALLTPAVLLVHGYHPLADDGAVYVTGIKKLANPSLYQSDAVFASSPTHLSIFAHVLAPLVLHWGFLPALLLVCHMASIFLFLLGSWSVAIRIFSTPRSCWGAVLLAACCFTLPVAGTSLSIMDPYVTARSFSTPLCLFALAAVLDEKWAKCFLWLTLAALLHPLMAGYAAISMLTLALARRNMWLALGVVLGMGWLLGAVVFVATRHADPSLAYNRAALSRSYFFLSSWRWYEYPGLLLPLMLLGFAGFRRRMPWAARTLAIAATVTGSCGLLVSLCFVHRSGSLLLARLQVLRIFHFVYLAGVLLGGGLLATLAQRHKRAIAVLCLLILAALFTGQRLTYPESDHVEWPGLTPRNRWQQAFLWIRANTPDDAIFALDNDYIESAGEDAQGFRATAERSAVADWFKDGGIASNFPQAALSWEQQSAATAQLNSATDKLRLARLQPLGVTWIVLPAEASTGFPCPFTNARVRVCRLSGALLHLPEGAK